MTAIRIYTVEEALALPPLTPDEIERRRLVLAEAAAATRRAFERRGGVPIPWDAIERALEWDYDSLDADVAK
jgi:hypothetical protein